MAQYVDSDGGAYPTVRAATNMLGSFEDVIKAGAAQPIGSAVAVLYSETADIYYDTGRIVILSRVVAVSASLTLEVSLLQLERTEPNSAACILRSSTQACRSRC